MFDLMQQIVLCLAGRIGVRPAIPMQDVIVMLSERRGLTQSLVVQRVRERVEAAAPVGTLPQNQKEH